MRADLTQSHHALGAVCGVAGGYFIERFQSDLGRPVLRGKIFRLRRRANQKYNGAVSSLHEGAFGHRHERWGEMRWTRQRRARKCDRRADFP